MNVQRALRRLRAPDELGAESRAWAVVRSAYQERLPVARSRFPLRLASVLAAGSLLAGALALSPAGATVGRLISRAVGVQHAAPALFSMPTPGRLLVSGAGGTWIVGPDGSTRRLGAWTDASWSPHGLYLTAANSEGLAALNPRGIPQWTLARRNVSAPRWYPPTGYRVAYLSGTELRVVAGDGSGDHLLAARVARVAPAWRPGHPYQLAYVAARGTIVVADGGSGRKLWSVRARAVQALMWSAGGQRLVALSPRELLVYDARGRLLSARAAPGGSRWADAALSPDGRTLALVSRGAGSAVIAEPLAGRMPATRRVLAGTGLGQIAWSPDGRWLLITWPAANQWVFVRLSGPPRILAASRIAQQFSAGARIGFPQLEGWCCTGTGAAG